MSGLFVAGYASLFGVADLAGDVVRAGAFARSLSNLPAGQLRMLMQHDPQRRLGRWTQAREDPVGLWVEGILDTTIADGLRAAALIGTGSLDGLSIGFRTQAACPLPGGGRRLDQIDLREVSLVAFPMLPRARLRVAATPSSLLAA
jgi:uncharacterized protein